VALSAFAPNPYTVSVGKATSSPCRNKVAASPKRARIFSVLAEDREDAEEQDEDEEEEEEKEEDGEEEDEGEDEDEDDEEDLESRKL